MSKNLPDWWVRISGTLGIFIALGSFAVSYFGYRWQRQVYEKSQEERVFVQLNAEYTFSSASWSEKNKSSQAQLTVEVVNLGMQPMYLKSITGQVAGHQVFFYEHDPLNAQPMRRLEPGEAADYTTDWEAPPVSPLSMEGTGATGVVHVETTKKWFTQSARIFNSRFTISDDVAAELPLLPHKKLLPPRPK